KRPGIEVPEDSNLIITDSSADESGNLIAVTHSDGAGIGSYSNLDSGSITITGGHVTGTAIGEAAGIGGGYRGTANVTITGGDVVATSEGSGAGIGGGLSSEGGNVTIEGGTIQATGRFAGAGIGGGQNADGGETIIE